MSRGGQSYRVLDSAVRDLRLHKLARATFHTGPVFRMGFDAHVQDWKRAVRAEAWREWCSNPEYRALHESEVQQRRAAPMPEWRK